MTRSNALLLLGALVILSPFSGLPLSWLEWLLPVLGAVIAGIGYTLRPVKPTVNPSALLPTETAPA